MKYMGSKNRIAKHILPIMLREAEVRQITTWIEPFVGGGNMIDKVPSSYERIGYDINPHVIMALIGIRDFSNKLPNEITELQYNNLKGTEPNPITSLVRFGASFGGKFENGFARGNDNSGQARNYWSETIRNAKNQSLKLQGVKLVNDSYESIVNVKNTLIYCDPPYQNTTSYKTETFDHEKFWNWCRDMSKDNLVFISEYNAPNDFNCIWRGEVKTNFASQRNKATHNAIEKLFVHNSIQISNYKKRTLF